MISPGAIVRVYRQGDTAYVVHSKLFDGRWRVIAKAVDGRGRGELLTSFAAGEGAIVVVRPAPSFAPGQQVKFNGSGASVVEDKGDTVLLAIPPSRFKTRAGDHLSLAASRAEVSKADLVIENL